MHRVIRVGCAAAALMSAGLAGQGAASASTTPFELPNGFGNSPLGWSAEIFIATPALDRVTGALVADCMLAQGASYSGDPVAASADHPAPSAEELARRRYTPPEERDGVWGYVFDADQGAESAGPAAPSEEEIELLWGDTSETVQLTGIDGSPVGEVALGDGCMADAVSQIFGSRDNYLAYLGDKALVEDLDHRSYGNLLTDPNALKVADEWSSCMSDAGYFFAMPHMVGAQDYASPRPLPDEQKIAAADAACRAATNVDVRLLEFEVQYSAGLAERNTPGIGERVSNWVAQINVMAQTHG